MFKIVKWGLIGGTAMAITGLLFFGRDLFSYASSSSRMLKTAVKDTIPVQFEIQRARDLLEDIIPEMHANLRLVAQEEVEVATLEKEVAREKDLVRSERAQIQKLRQTLVSYPGEGASEGPKRNVEELSQRFERFRTGEMLLSGKEKLLANRRKSLQAAIHRLEKTRLARMELAAQIEGLEGQFRLIQAQGTSSDLRIDESKLAKTQRLLADLRKRLEVAQRVLEREAHFAEPTPLPTVTAEALVEEIDEHFQKGKRAEPAVTVRASMAEDLSSPGAAR